MRFGEASMIRCTTFFERPARGGPTTTTSGRPAPAGKLGPAPHGLGSPAGGRLGRAPRGRPESAGEGRPEPLAEPGRERARLELAVGRHDPDLQLPAVAAFPHDEVAQPRVPV